MDKQELFINFCKGLKNLSKCKVNGVGCIITDPNFSQIYAIGYNGGPKGQQECLCDGDKYSCVHAEQNALVKCVDHIEDKIMIVTMSPCKMCAALIVNSKANIKEVWYLQEYRNTLGLDILNKAGIITKYINS